MTTSEACTAKVALADNFNKAGVDFDEIEKKIYPYSTFLIQTIQHLDGGGFCQDVLAEFLLKAADLSESTSMFEFSEIFENMDNDKVNDPRNIEKELLFNEYTWYEEGEILAWIDGKIQNKDDHHQIECELAEAFEIAKEQNAVLVIQPQFQNQCIFADFSKE